MNRSQAIETISRQDFLALGMKHLAYIKPVELEGKPAFAVFAADGSQLAVMASRDIAAAAVRQHDMEPVSIH